MKKGEEGPSSSSKSKDPKKNNHSADNPPSQLFGRGRTRTENITTGGRKKNRGKFSSDELYSWRGRGGIL